MVEPEPQPAGGSTHDAGVTDWGDANFSLVELNLFIVQSGAPPPAQDLQDHPLVEGQLQASNRAENYKNDPFFFVSCSGRMCDGPEIPLFPKKNFTGDDLSLPRCFANFFSKF